MKRVALLMLVLAFCTYCTKGRSPSTIDDAGQAKAGTAAAYQQTNPGITQRAYIDPETGEFVNPPEHETPAASKSIQPSALSISAETMEEASSPVPGGGVMIDLKGRYQHSVSATVKADGKATVEHPTGGRME